LPSSCRGVREIENLLVSNGFDSANGNYFNTIDTLGNNVLCRVDLGWEASLL